MAMVMAMVMEMVMVMEMEMEMEMEMTELMTCGDRWGWRREVNAGVN